MSETNNKQQNNTERKPFRIMIDEHPKFPGTSKSAYIISDDLCKLTSEVFKSAFDDFEGCRFEVEQNGLYYVTLFFNHGDYGKDATVACERIDSTQHTGSRIIDRSRSIDARIKHGDRYYLTEDGKDVISTLLIPSAYNRGNIKWGNIVYEFAEQNPYGMYNTNPYNVNQYTAVRFIDPSRLVSLIYGRKNGDDTFEYAAELAATLPGYQGANTSGKYVLNVTQADVQEIEKLASKLGINQNTQMIR